MHLRVYTHAGMGACVSMFVCLSLQARGGLCLCVCVCVCHEDRGVKAHAIAEGVREGRPD
jgi:hypothetical protein